MTKQNDMLNEKLRKTSTKAQFITYVINPVVRLIGQFGYVLIAVRGAMAVISGALRIGDVQAAFQYVNQLSEPVTQLSYTANNLQGALASAERVYDLLDAVEELPDQTDETLLPRPQGNVLFENVRFSYDQDKAAHGKYQHNGKGRQQGRNRRPYRFGQDHARELAYALL